MLDRLPFLSIRASAARDSRPVTLLSHTLLESAKLTGVEPAGYLAEATRRAIATPGTVTLPRDLRGA